MRILILYIFHCTNERISLRMTGVRMKETKEVFEGEVTEITPTEVENPLSGYGKTISHVVIGLKTAKGTKQLRLDPTIYDSILLEKVVVGDVIYIEANSGTVKVCILQQHNTKEGIKADYDLANGPLRRICLRIRS